MVLALWLALGTPSKLSQNFTVSQLLKQRDITGVAFSGNSRKLAIVCRDGSLQLYRRENVGWAHFGSRSGLKGIRGLSWSNDGSTLCWITNRQTAAIWRAGESQSSEISISNRTGEVVDLKLSSCGTWFASSAGYKVCWGRVNGKVIDGTIKAGPSSPSIIFVSDSDLIVGGHSLTRYSLRTGQRRIISKNTPFVQSLCLDSVRQRLAILTFGTQIEIRSALSGRLEKKIMRGQGYPVGLAWADDGRYLASELCANHKAAKPDWYTRIQVFRSSNGHRVDYLPLNDSDIGEMVVPPSSKSICIFSNFGLVNMWNFSGSDAHDRQPVTIRK